MSIDEERQTAAVRNGAFAAIMMATGVILFGWLVLVIMNQLAVQQATEISEHPESFRADQASRAIHRSRELAGFRKDGLIDSVKSDESGVRIYVGPALLLQPDSVRSSVILRLGRDFRHSGGVRSLSVYDADGRLAVTWNVASGLSKWRRLRRQ